MAVSKTTGYNWLELDPQTLPPKALAAYQAMKEANRIAATAREGFETTMASIMPDATFGYRFGKLSFTTDAPKERKVTASPKAMSLADYLAARKAHGDRA